MKKYYKALLFGSIGTLVETSEIQRKSFNEAFKKKGLNWYWTKEEYIKLLNKSGGSDRIKEYAKKKNRNNLTSILPTYRLDHINIHTHM